MKSLKLRDDFIGQVLLTINSEYLILSCIRNSVQLIILM